MIRSILNAQERFCTFIFFVPLLCKNELYPSNAVKDLGDNPEYNVC